jgi:hypothetical protein
MSLRIVKIITPSDECLNVDLGGDESALADLLSMICGIPVDNIKGLQDIYGNYYTLGSAVSNMNINSDFSSAFYLICGGRYTSLYSNNTNNDLNYVTNYSNYSHMPSSSNAHVLNNMRNGNFFTSLGNNFKTNNRSYSRFPRNQITFGSNFIKNSGGFPNQNYNTTPLNNTNNHVIQSNYTHSNSLGSNSSTNSQTRKTRYTSTRENNSTNNQVYNPKECRSCRKSRTRSHFSEYTHNTNNSQYSQYYPREIISQPQMKNQYHYSNIKTQPVNSYFSEEELDSSGLNSHSHSNFNQKNVNSSVLNRDFEDGHNYGANQLYTLDDYQFGQKANLHDNSKRCDNFPSPRFGEEKNENNEKNVNNENTGPQNSSNHFNNHRKTQEKLSNMDIEKYLTITQEIYEASEIDSRGFTKLTKLILKEKEEVKNLFKFHCLGIVDRKSLVLGLNKILSLYGESNSRPTSPVQVKTKLLKLVENLDLESLLEEASDSYLLKNLIEYENEFIMGAFEVYESDMDLQNFIESIKILINRSKRKSSFLPTNRKTNSVSVMKETPNLNHNNHNNHNNVLVYTGSNININNLNENHKLFSPTTNTNSTLENNLTGVTPIQIPIFKPSKRNSVDNLEDVSDKENSINKNKASPQSIKSLIMPKEIETQILSSLHTEDRIIFKWAIKNKLPDLELIQQLLEAFNKPEVVIKPVKYICKKFIADNIIKSLDESEKLKFNEIISNREKNKNLVLLFKDFTEHQNLLRLEKDVISFIKNSMKSKNTALDSSVKKTERKRISSSDTGSIIMDDESLVKERKLDTPIIQMNPVEVTSAHDDFVNLVNIMKFLRPDEKKEFETMVKNKNKQAMEVIDNYYKNKSIVTLKSSVLNLVRKNINKSGPRDSIKDSKDSYNNYANISISNNNGEPKESNHTINLIQATQVKTSQKSNNSGKILNKLEKLENYKQNSNSSMNQYLFLQNESKENKIFKSIELVLEDLEKSEVISSLQHKYIVHRYKNSDDVVNSAWEVYTKTKDLPELVESLKIFARNINKITPPSLKIPLPVTPADLKESKKEIIEFLKSKPSKKEKESVKLMQYNMIKILARDNSVEKSYLPLLKEMIQEENPFLISAFEVFGVTKDHHDFINTINIIAYLYNNNTVSKSEVPDKLNNLLETFLESSTFTQNEKEFFIRAALQKNQYLMSSIELYETSKDPEELVDSLRILLKKK